MSAGVKKRSETESGTVSEEIQIVIDFQRDDSQGSSERSVQVREIMCQLILLSQKKGRPKKNEEETQNAA